MNSVSPVFTEAEVSGERVVALDQPEYFPIVVLRVEFQDRDGEVDCVATATRYRFTAEERARIANGEDLVIYQPHRGAVMPLGFKFAKPGEYPR